MKIVIDIPKEDWEFIKESDGCRWSRAIIEGIINGTPLPKGHGDLIDRSEIIKSLFDYHKGQKTIGQCIDDVQTIIEADKEESEDKEWK